MFELVDPKDIPDDALIFDTRFVNEIKNKRTEQTYEKSRLVVQAYNDTGKRQVLTQSPTIQRINQRIILCIVPIKHRRVHLYLRDITQAYTQSLTRLNRHIYIRAPPELARLLGVPVETIVRVLQPLYGIPESGNHWYQTYHSHHINALAIEQSTYDACLLYSKEPFGVVGLQTNDTLIVADTQFAQLEQKQLEKAKFLTKERETLTEDKRVKFNGGIIQLEDTTITLTQEHHCTNLQPVTDRLATTTNSRKAVQENLTTKQQFVAQRARGTYITSVCQPETAYDLSVAAQAIEPKEKNVEALNKRLQWQVQNTTRGLKFVKLDENSLQLLVFTDASFANNKDLSSQIGYVIVLADGERNRNILH